MKLIVLASLFFCQVAFASKHNIHFQVETNDFLNIKGFFEREATTKLPGCYDHGEGGWYPDYKTLDLAATNGGSKIEFDLDTDKHGFCGYKLSWMYPIFETSDGHWIQIKYLVTSEPLTDDRLCNEIALRDIAEFKCSPRPNDKWIKCDAIKQDGTIYDPNKGKGSCDVPFFIDPDLDAQLKFKMTFQKSNIN